MDKVLAFMSDSPFLTFFLAALTYGAMKGLVRSFTGKYPPAICEKCKCSMDPDYED